MKRIFILLFFLSFIEIVCSASIRQPLPKFKKFPKFHFKISIREGWVHKFLDTANREIKIHRWTKASTEHFFEIRVAKNLVHMSFPRLRGFYDNYTGDIFSSLEMLVQGAKYVKTKWLWVAKYKAKLKNGKNVKVRLFIMKHKKLVYFISSITPGNQATDPDIINMINSLKYLK